MLVTMMTNVNCEIIYLYQAMAYPLPSLGNGSHGIRETRAFSEMLLYYKKDVLMKGISSVEGNVSIRRLLKSGTLPYCPHNGKAVIDNTKTDILMKSKNAISFDHSELLFNDDRSASVPRRSARRQPATISNFISGVESTLCNHACEIKSYGSQTNTADITYSQHCLQLLKQQVDSLSKSTLPTTTNSIENPAIGSAILSDETLPNCGPPVFRVFTFGYGMEHCILLVNAIPHIHCLDLLMVEIEQYLGIPHSLQLLYQGSNKKLLKATDSFTKAGIKHGSRVFVICKHTVSIIASVISLIVVARTAAMQRMTGMLQQADGICGWHNPEEQADIPVPVKATEQVNSTFVVPVQSETAVTKPDKPLVPAKQKSYKVKRSSTLKNVKLPQIADAKPKQPEPEPEPEPESQPEPEPEPEPEEEKIAISQPLVSILPKPDPEPEPEAVVASISCDIKASPKRKSKIKLSKIRKKSTAAPPVTKRNSEEHDLLTDLKRAADKTPIEEEEEDEQQQQQQQQEQEQQEQQQSSSSDDTFAVPLKSPESPKPSLLASPTKSRRRSSAVGGVRKKRSKPIVLTPVDSQIKTFPPRLSSIPQIIIEGVDDYVIEEVQQVIELETAVESSEVFDTVWDLQTRPPSSAKSVKSISSVLSATSTRRKASKRDPIRPRRKSEFIQETKPFKYSTDALYIKYLAGRVQLHCHAIVICIEDFNCFGESSVEPSSTQTESNASKRIPFALSDAIAMMDILKKLGFSVDFLHSSCSESWLNTTQENVLEAISIAKSYNKQNTNSDSNPRKRGASEPPPSPSSQPLLAVIMQTRGYMKSEKGNKPYLLFSDTQLPNMIVDNEDNEKQLRSSLEQSFKKEVNESQDKLKPPLRLDKFLSINSTSNTTGYGKPVLFIDAIAIDASRQGFISVSGREGRGGSLFAQYKRAGGILLYYLKKLLRGRGFNQTGCHINTITAMLARKLRVCCGVSPQTTALNEYVVGTDISAGKCLLTREDLNIEKQQHRKQQQIFRVMGTLSTGFNKDGLFVNQWLKLLTKILIPKEKTPPVSRIVTNHIKGDRIDILLEGTAYEFAKFDKFRRTGQLEKVLIIEKLIPLEDLLLDTAALRIQKTWAGKRVRSKYVVLTQLLSAHAKRAKEIQDEYDEWSTAIKEDNSFMNITALLCGEQFKRNEIFWSQSDNLARLYGDHKRDLRSVEDIHRHQIEVAESDLLFFLLEVGSRTSILTEEFLIFKYAMSHHKLISIQTWKRFQIEICQYAGYLEMRNNARIACHVHEKVRPRPVWPFKADRKVSLSHKTVIV